MFLYHSVQRQRHTWKQTGTQLFCAKIQNALNFDSSFLCLALSRLKNPQNLFCLLILLADYHGINGNVSLDRRSEIVQSPNRYDLTLGSDKSSSSRNGTTYDVVEAERNNQQNIINNNTIASTPTSFGTTQTNGNNNDTLDRNGDGQKRKWPTDKAYFLSKEILMTERTYKRDLDVINSVSFLQRHTSRSLLLKFILSALPKNDWTRRC